MPFDLYLPLIRKTNLKPLNIHTPAITKLMHESTAPKLPKNLIM